MPSAAFERTKLTAFYDRDAERRDGALLERVRRVFELVAFRRLRVAEDDGYHVQSLVLRRPSSPP